MAMTQPIVLDRPMSLDELRAEVARGARFVVFQYCYSFLAVTVPRFSPAFLVFDRADLVRARRKYNVLSGCLGWWAVPWGPVVTIRAWWNNRAGLDVTNDIMVNITDDSLERGEVLIERCHDVFAKPKPAELKTFRKTVVGDLGADDRLRRVIVAFYVNTEATPHLTIGIEFAGDFEEIEEAMRAQLAIHYHERVRFELVDLHDESEQAAALVEQGASLLGGLPVARALRV